jgi:hypothetical protein
MNITPSTLSLEDIMKKLLSLAAIFGLFLALTVVATDQAQAQSRPANKGFVDANNDGINDNAQDADGDGIPNGQDPDYVGTSAGNGRGFVDENGDGINDNAPDADGDGIPNGQDPDFVRGSGTGSGWHGGQSGQSGQGGVGTGDGTGTGTGDCDGTGPKGSTQRRGRK